MLLDIVESIGSDSLSYTRLHAKGTFTIVSI